MPTGFLVADIDKAVKKVETQDLGYGLNIIKSLHNFFTKTKSELLIEFLHVRGRRETADQIAQMMYAHANSPHRQFNVDPVDAEIQAFINAILETAPQVFDFRLPPADIPRTKEKYIKWYKANGYADHVKTVQEYKKLVSDVCNTLGYKEPSYNLFGLFRKDFFYFKHYNLSDADEVLGLLADRAMRNYDDQQYLSTYKYTTYNGSLHLPAKLTSDSDLSKQNAKVRKGLLNKILAGVSSLIGVGEGFAPAKFYLGRLLLVGCTIPFSYAFAGFAFFAAFSVNTLLFHADSYNSFKNLNPLGKNRLFRDAKGRPLGWPEIARNVFAVACAFFSALVLGFVSFKFSGLSVIAAGIIGVMTFIGYFGVLSYNATNVWSTKTVKNFFGEYLHKLLIKPLKKIRKVGLFTQTGAEQLLTFLVNSTAVLAMGVFGVGIIAVTSAMFFQALMSIPLLAVVAGVLGVKATVFVKAIIFAAEIALGSFFARNVSKSIDVIRRGVLEFPSTLKNVYQAVKNYLHGLVYFNIPKHSANQANEIRSARVNLGRVLGAVLVTFAFVNAGGFAFGYFGTVITHSALAFVFGPMILVVAPLMAALNYMFASVGGNSSASLAAVSAPEELPPIVRHNPFGAQHSESGVVVALATASPAGNEGYDFGPAAADWYSHSYPNGYRRDADIDHHPLPGFAAGTTTPLLHSEFAPRRSQDDLTEQRAGLGARSIFQALRAVAPKRERRPASQQHLVDSASEAVSPQQPLVARAR